MLKRFIRNRKGNFSTIFALSAIPITFGLGAAADYGFAVQTRAHMNAAADAAALAAVTPQVMSQNTTYAKLAVTQMFNTQVSGLPRLAYDPTSLTVNITDQNVNNRRVRTVGVSYSAASQTAFAKILHMSTIPIHGSSTASATTSPNIDFYLMLDTSPSMEIAATVDGINTMVANTKDQCAFACHETNPAGDGLTQDYYSLSKQLNVTLRIDMVRQAVQQLSSTAQNAMNTTGAAYRLAGYTFDVAVGNVFNLPDSMSSVQTKSNSIQALTVYQNSYITQGNNNNDQDTNFDLAFSTLNQTMPAPGNGTNTTGDTPQAVLMIVSDGVADENSNGNRIFTPFGTNPNWCTTIKNRGIRIAVLYTTYNPLPTNPFYNANIAPEQSQIEAAAQACASPGLFQQVDTGGDIATAMSALFNTSIASARLTN